MEKLEILYNYLVSQNYNVGKDYNEFKLRLSDPKKREAFFNYFGQKYNLGKDLNDFTNKIASSLNIKQQSPAPKVDQSNLNANFSCILNNSKWGQVVKQVDQNHIMYEVSGYEGREFHFYSDGKFEYKDVYPYKSLTGSWMCNGEDNFVIKTEDDALFDSIVNKWSYHVSQQIEPDTTSTNTQSQQPASNKNYIKIGDKGEIVGKLQNLLISKGFPNISKSGKPDNIFGNRTKNSVIDFQTKNSLNPDGIVGPNTWEKLTGSRIISEAELVKKIVAKNLKSLIK